MALVVVQRGHCFRTTGATGAPGEQEFTEAAADRVARHVRAMGHDVRVINADVPDSQYAGDLFVALHYDSSSSPLARGASVGWQTDEGRRFAQAWKDAYADAGWSGGFRADNYTTALANYYGVRRAVAQGNRRAFIAEAGFHSSPADAALLAAPEGPDRVGRAVAAAVASIVGGTPPQEEIDMPLDATDKAWIREQLGLQHGAIVTGNENSLANSTQRGWGHMAANPAGLNDLRAQIAAKNIDVDEAAIAAALAPVLASAVLAALPDEVTEHVTFEDLERAVVSGLGKVRLTPAAS